MPLVTSIVLGVTIVTAQAAGQEASPPYKDPRLPIERRVADLLTRMTIEEKVDQISGGRPIETGVLDPTGRYTDANLGDTLGQMYDPYTRRGARDWAVFHNALQRYRLEK
ncbi:MAG TPA: hypothetical protein VL691_15785, partial [Vicinamibacteria bacterium]|nr:hypothetical protein [Vicinamibacteria bacterium]